MALSTGGIYTLPQPPDNGILDWPLSLVGAGAKAIWRPDPGFVTTASGGITQLDDQSGTGNTATQPGASSARPTLTTRLGQSVISFDGNDRLQIAGSVLSGNDNWSMALIYECTSLAATRALLALSAGSGGATYILNDGAAKRGLRTQGFGTSQDGDATTSPEAVIVSREAGTLMLYMRDGAHAFDIPGMGMGTPGGTSAIGALLTSGTFPFAGFLWLALVTQGVGLGYLDASQRTGFFDYSLAQFGI